MCSITLVPGAPENSTSTSVSPSLRIASGGLRGRVPGLGGTPISPEVVGQVKDEILHQEYLPTLDVDYGHPAVLTHPSVTIGELDIPVHSDDIGATESKDVPNTDILDVKLDPWELVKELTKPTFDSSFSPESTARWYFTRVDELPVIPPG